MLVIMLVDGHNGVMHDDQGQGDSSYLTTTMSMIINMVTVTMIVMLVTMVSFMVRVDHGNVEITNMTPINIQITNILRYFSCELIIEQIQINQIVQTPYLQWYLFC